MTFIILFLFFLALGFYWPKYLLYMITVPLVGTALGGFAWGVCAMYTSQLVTWPAFGTFLIVGNLVALVSGFLLDREEGAKA